MVAPQTPSGRIFPHEEWHPCPGTQIDGADDVVYVAIRRAVSMFALHERTWTPHPTPPTPENAALPLRTVRGRLEAGPD
jgi:hypothetical protein